MARLPSERYLMQQIGGSVVLFEDYTERQITHFDPADSMDAATALEIIMGSELGDEDRSFACFWAGYFHAYAGPDAVMARDPAMTQADDGTVFVMDGNAVVVSFDPADQNATAMAQKNIYDSALIPLEQARRHFWCGVFYGLAGMSDPETDLRDRAPNRGALADEET